jgi:hypothetical protein
MKISIQLVGNWAKLDEIIEEHLIKRLDHNDRNGQAYNIDKRIAHICAFNHLNEIYLSESLSSSNPRCHPFRVKKLAFK